MFAGLTGGIPKNRKFFIIRRTTKNGQVNPARDDAPADSSY